MDSLQMVKVYVIRGFKTYGKLGHLSGVEHKAECWVLHGDTFCAYTAAF